jgi:glycosyltransferase involved in cell wall biosynthesis
MSGAPRVLHIVTSLEAGGAQTSVADIASGLRARGLDAHVAYSSRGGLMPASDRALVGALARAGVPTHDLATMRRSPSAWDVLALGQMGALLRRLRPALVHTHASKAGLLGRIAAARAGVRIAVHTVRGWPFHGCSGARRVAYIEAERRLARLATRMVAVSPAMVEAGVRLGIGAPGDYVVIRSGIELARFRRTGADAAATRRSLGIPPGARVVGSVMRLVAAKAPLDLIAVAARVVREIAGAHVVVVGDGPERAAMERAIAAAGLAAQVHLLGERADVPDLLRAFDAFLLTSRWEGMPRVLVEAAVAGVPIAATDVGGCRDLVLDGHSGILCAPGDVDALAAGVIRLLREPQWAQRLATACAGRVTADFDLGAVVDQHLSLYAALGLRI